MIAPLKVLLVLATFLLIPLFGQRSQLKLIYPNGLALDPQGRLYISDIGTHRIIRLESGGKLTPIAGDGEAGFGGDLGPATKARLSAPHDIVFDQEGRLLIADSGNHRIRRIDRQGVITTVAGDGRAGKAGYNDLPLETSLNNPQSLALDPEGRILIADTYNHVVRRLKTDGKMTRIAGSLPGYGGDGGPAIDAQMSLPMAVAVGPSGEILISDAGNSRIRKLSTDGKIQTIAGFGPAQDTYGGGYAGDGGPAEKAKIFSVTDLKFRADGDFLLVDSGNHRLRIVHSGVMTTLAGAGRSGFTGDGKPAIGAELNTPQKLVLDRDGSILFSDRINHRVRKIDAKGLITTIAGDGKPGEALINE